MPNWLDALKDEVAKHHLGILRISGSEWDFIQNSAKGLSAFTIARAHEQVKAASAGRLSLFLPAGKLGPVYIGIVTSKQPITTVQTRIGIVGGSPVFPAEISDIERLIADDKVRRRFAGQTSKTDPYLVLTASTSTAAVDVLAGEVANHQALETLSELLAPTYYSNAASLQSDAIETALKVFGFDPKRSKTKIFIPNGSDSRLASRRLLEDAVIEHDARSVPRMDLVGSSVTGFAEFEGGGDRLRVYTANKKPLEQLFGVDLIYLNLKLGNMVLLQYKMLEKDKEDWIYRPDKQLDKEVMRIETFRNASSGRPDYRLNPEAFYFKFVKRDASTGSASCIMPVDHFNLIRGKNIGPGGGVRISYDELNGQYLRESCFIDLVKCGYIGAHSDVSKAFEKLIKEILDGGNAIVAAIQEEISGS